MYYKVVLINPKWTLNNHRNLWTDLRNLRKIVGINHGVLDEEDMPPLLKPDSELGNKQKFKLEKLREQRDQSAVDQILNSIKIAAEGQQNLFPLVIEALRNDCTLGEIISAMKDVFGTYMAPSGF